MLTHEAMKIRQADDQGSDHGAAEAGFGRDLELPPHRIEIARQARHIMARLFAVGGDQSIGDRLDPCGDRRVGLVGKAVVVLDIVYAAFGEALCDRRELRQRQALWLQSRRGQGAALGADARSQAGKPVSRAAEIALYGAWQYDVV